MFTARGRNVKDYTCLSTDTKPIGGVANGAILLEIDTGKFYVFDEAGSRWVELP